MPAVTAGKAQEPVPRQASQFLDRLRLRIQQLALDGTVALLLAVALGRVAGQPDDLGPIGMRRKPQPSQHVEGVAGLTLAVASLHAEA